MQYEQPERLELNIALRIRRDIGDLRTNRFTIRIKVIIDACWIITACRRIQCLPIPVFITRDIRQLRGIQQVTDIDHATIITIIEIG